MQSQRFAPAKVNLFLHVGPLGADGYHPICSLMTFASVGDVVRLSRTDAMSFEVRGPFSNGLTGDDNLVVKARDALMAAVDRPWPPIGLILEKRLPVAAGLGGGSSDAAATLSMLCEAFDLRLDDAVAAIARRLGSDVIACLAAVPVLARGRGDELAAPPAFPDVDAVLVNPNVPSRTAAVYAAFDEGRARRAADEPAWPDLIETPEALAAFLDGCRNDLEGPAIALQPAIAEVLADLRGRPQTLIARMSGSGATCFAFCASEHDARELARAVSKAQPGWWVEPCRLAGFRS